MIKSDGYILREVAGSNVLVPFGDKAVDFNGIITLNDTASFIWENIADEFTQEDIIKLICDSYDDVDEETAKASAVNFIDTLKGVGAVE